jgi:BlaI family penicillinase repressor
MAAFSFTDRELDVMSVLWAKGSATVAEVREALTDELGYTSVLKVLQILEMKGAVSHESEGRAYRYSPRVQPDEAGTTALKRIVDKIFHGSAELLLARLISDRDIPPDELERMRSLLDDDGEEGADR